MARRQAVEPKIDWDEERDPPLFVRLGDRPVGWTNDVSLLRARRKRRHNLSTLFKRIGTFGLLAVLAVVTYQYWPSISLPSFTSASSEPSFSFSKAANAQGLIPNLKAESNASVIHRVKSGETIGTIVSKFGAPWEAGIELHNALKSLSKAKSIPSTIRVGQQLVFGFSADGSIESMSFRPGAGQSVVLKRQAKGDFLGEFDQLPRFDHERIAYGTVNSSFGDAANKVGVSYDLVDQLVDLFGDRVVFHRDFRKGDRFSIIYNESVLSDGTVVSSGPIKSAALEIGGRRLAVIRHLGTDKRARYFNEDGRLVGNTFLRYPLKFSRISSYFSHSRLHPVLKIRRPHHGVDFAAPRGTAVRTVADGKVTFAGRKGPNGIMIKIRHNNRYRTAYLHLAGIAKGVRRGSFVKRGQRIGSVGSTGLSTGPHLDFRFYDRGRSVDPLKVKLPSVGSVGKKDKISKEKLKSVLERIDGFQQQALEGKTSNIS